jgi:hypothetical protein
MMFRLFTIIAAVSISCGPALAQDYNFTHDVPISSRTDPTSRDSPNMNDATTASDRVTEHAMREKIPGGHVHPEHRVIVHRHNGAVTTTDIYLIPEPPEPDEIYR